RVRNGGDQEGNRREGKSQRGLDSKSRFIEAAEAWRTRGAVLAPFRNLRRFCVTLEPCWADLSGPPVWQNASRCAGLSSNPGKQNGSARPPSLSASRKRDQ